MKKLLIIPAVIFAFACNNSKKESAEKTESNTGTENVANPGPATDNPPASDYVPVTNITYMADGAEIKNAASVLVTKDKDNLKAGAPFVCMLTSNAAKNNNEYLTLNFLLDTKPGTYPVVGSSFQRGKSPNDEMYGSILGGKPKLTEYKVIITECRDLGSNNMDGKKLCDFIELLLHPGNKRSVYRKCSGEIRDQMFKLYRAETGYCNLQHKCSLRVVYFSLIS